MPKREYEGSPIDQTWQDFADRPYKGKGKTVDVVDDRLTDSRGYFEVDGSFNLSEKHYQVFEKLTKKGPLSVRELADLAGVTKRCARNAIEKLESEGLAGTNGDVGQYGAKLYRTTIGFGDKITFSNGIDSDSLVSKTHPLRLTPNQRKVLAHAARFPTKTKMKIGEAVGIHHANVGKILQEHGDPRREIQHISVGHAETELKLIEERLEGLRERRDELLKTVNNGAIDNA